MRRIARYIHELPDWPGFHWQHEKIAMSLASVRHKQGKLLGKLEGLGFTLREEASLKSLTEEIVKSSDIEDEKLPYDQVRSSIVRKLGLQIGGIIPSDQHVDGVVTMLLDATQKYTAPLSVERLFGWHTALFPAGQSGLYKILVGAWRTEKNGPMQVISGAFGKERIHFEAPAASRLKLEIKKFLKWFNEEKGLDPVIMAALAHLWFLTIHPFEDGNGRIARAIADMQLSRSDSSKQRFYSMSAQIRKERKDYYDFLKKTQQGTLDVTNWLLWFLDCLDRALITSEENLAIVLRKAAFWTRHQSTVLSERQVLMLNRLFDGLEGKLTTSKWAKLAKCSPDTALRDIQDLVGKGVIEKEPERGRSTNYRARW